MNLRRRPDPMTLLVERDTTDRDLATIIRSLAAAETTVALRMMPEREKRGRHEKPDFGGAA